MGLLRRDRRDVERLLDPALLAADGAKEVPGGRFAGRASGSRLHPYQDGGSKMRSSTESSSLSPLLAVPTAAIAWLLTGFFPLTVLPASVIAALGVGMILVRTHRMGWLAWVLIGLPVGVGLYFALAALNVLIPGASSGEATGSAGG